MEDLLRARTFRVSTSEAPVQGLSKSGYRPKRSWVACFLLRNSLQQPSKEGFLELFAPILINSSCSAELSPAVKTASYIQTETALHSSCGRKSWRLR